MKLVPDLTSCPLEFYAFLKNKNISIDLVKVMQRCSFCTMLFSRNDLFYLNGQLGMYIHLGAFLPPCPNMYTTITEISMQPLSHYCKTKYSLHHTKYILKVFFVIT